MNENDWMLDPRELLSRVGESVSTEDLASALLQRINQPGTPPAKARMGVVQSVSGGSASVLVAGSTTPVPGIPLLGGPPTAGQTVVLLQFGSSYVALGAPGQASDTVWGTATMASGHTGQVRTRVRNGVLYLEGYCSRSLGTTNGAFETVCTLVHGYTVGTAYIANSAVGGTLRFALTADGTLKVNASGAFSLVHVSAAVPL